MIKFAQTLEEKEHNQSMSANEIELTDGELGSVHGAFWGYGYNPGYGSGYDPSYGFSGYPSTPVVVVVLSPGSASQTPVDQSQVGQGPVGPSPVGPSPAPTFPQPSAPVVQ